MYYHANIFLRIFLRYRTWKVYQKYFIIVLSSRAVMLSVTTPVVSLFSLVDQNKHSDGDRCGFVVSTEGLTYDSISFQRFSQTRKGVFRPLFTSTFRGIFLVIFLQYSWSKTKFVTPAEKYSREEKEDIFSPH